MECRTGLCGRTSLTSGANEFFFFSDLEVKDVGCRTHHSVTMETVYVLAPLDIIKVLLHQIRRYINIVAVIEKLETFI
jgi:hypothetical protein